MKATVATIVVNGSEREAVMASISIRIDQSLVEQARVAAKAEYRTVQGQIEFWAKLGKCALDNPDLPIEFVKELLISKQLDRSLAEPFEFE